MYACMHVCMHVMCKCLFFIVFNAISLLVSGIGNSAVDIAVDLSRGGEAGVREHPSRGVDSEPDGAPGVSRQTPWPTAASSSPAPFPGCSGWSSSWPTSASAIETMVLEPNTGML